MLLLLAWVSYHPGLGGGFLFDDFVNLPALGTSGAVDDWPTFWRYITSGSADPTGRPLALLSFLIDARDWPADPAPFLRTNLILHLINGALLFLLLRELGRSLDGDSKRTDAAALLGTGLWLLHPLFVSTTLYIVQREAMLPATFVLLGMLAWIRGRGLLDTAPRAGTIWMLAGVGLGTLLAVLSKANGLLLPLLLWVLEATILRGGSALSTPDAARRLRRLKLILLILPSCALFAHLLNHLPQLSDDQASRPWTIGQRLLTEPRVLLDYLQLLVVPRVLSTGLYNDAYTFSTGLLQPFTTLPAMVLVLGLLALGFGLRRRAPALSAALLFFFAGHLLESTVVALELYFEHRNYLPAMLLFWPLARAICAWKVSPWLRTGLAIALLALLALITWQRAGLWGQQERMALLWAAQNPNSSRAQATAASFEQGAHRAEQAMQRLAIRWQKRPYDLQLALNYISAACAVRGIRPEEIDAVAAALSKANEGDQLVHRWLDRALDTAKAGDCAGLDLAVIQCWLSAAQANPRLTEMRGRQQDLYSLTGRLALERGEPEQALTAFNHALEAWTTPQAAAMQAALLASQDHYDLALAHLDHYATLDAHDERVTGWNMRRLHQWVLVRQAYWPHELAVLRKQLEADLAAQLSTATATEPAQARERQ